MVKPIIAFFLLFIFFSPPHSFAIDNPEILSQSRQISRSSRQLQILTEDYVDKVIEAETLIERIKTLQAKLDTFESLIREDSSDINDRVICIEKMRNMNYSNTNASSYCESARGFEIIFANCTYSFINMNYSHMNSAQHCMTSNRYGSDVASCTNGMIDLNYSHMNAVSYCQRIKRESLNLPTCVSAMINLNYSHLNSASFCVDQKDNLLSYPNCVERLLDQGYDHLNAADTCKI